MTPGKSDLGRMLLEAMDSLPENQPNREILFFYESEYSALDKACQDQFGMSLPQYLGDQWNPKIIRPIPPVVSGEVHCYFKSQELYDQVQQQSWYARLWMRYARFCAHILGKPRNG